MFQEIQFCINFDYNSINPDVLALLKERERIVLDDKIQIHKVINQVLIEIADSIFFHANDVNAELYNYAFETHSEKLEEKKLKDKEEEKVNKGKLFLNLYLY